MLASKDDAVTLDSTAERTTEANEDAGERPAGSQVVRAREIHYDYVSGGGSLPVLNGLSLDIAESEIVMLTGPSGSGKTTLLTLIGALRTIQRGSLEVLGKELACASGADRLTLRREIGFVFQTHNLLDALTASQNVSLALELKSVCRENRDKAADALTKVGLGHRLGHRPNAMSIGECQRVSIARAIVNRPRLLLADEPTAALDNKSTERMLAMFRDLVDAEGCSMIAVTHDPRTMDVADRIIAMDDGRLHPGTPL
ncbi:ABC transporter ATP-binding protein [Kolteria novifilia]|uniref:ABC transporter ATP-binding protein n=1 Tax=Kolteria novifilia TaxID=2527975 RepID=UPI003AF395FF